METILKDIHLSSEQLEEYVRGGLRTTEAARISGHLFECDSCNQRYDEEATLLISLRNAKAPALADKPVAMLPFWSRIFATPVPLFAAALTVVLVFFFVPRLSFNTTPVVAELTAFRSATSTSAAANHPLLLRLDTTGLDEVRQFRAELADSSGNQVWNGTAVRQDGRQQVSVDKRLASGQYWVRLYASDKTDLLREFSLQLK
jgi:hypothetical protein